MEETLVEENANQYEIMYETKVSGVDELTNQKPVQEDVNLIHKKSTKGSFLGNLPFNKNKTKEQRDWIRLREFIMSFIYNSLKKLNKK